MSNLACEICSCADSFANTGESCTKQMRDTYNVFFVEEFANDGTKNSYDPSVPFDETFLLARLNDPDASKRWYPVANSDGLKNLKSLRDDPKTREFTDGDKEFIRQGIKNMEFLITGMAASPAYVGVLESVRCIKSPCIFRVDRGMNFIGKKTGDGKLYPVKINAGSFSATYNEADPDTKNQEIKVMFSYSISEKDSSAAMVACSDITADLFSAEGLIDVCPVFSNIHKVSFSVALTTETIDVKNPTPAQGLVLSDFVLFDVTANAPITITSVTESSPGNYDFVYPTVTIGHVLKLTPTKNGFDFTCVKNTPINIAHT